MPKSPTAAIKKLLAEYDNGEALLKLSAIGEPVLPVLRRAYTALDPDDRMMAGWFSRVLSVVAPDPVGEALALLDQVDERHCAELAWVLRRFASNADAVRCCQALDAALRVDSPDELVWRLLRIAVASEAVGLTGSQADMKTLHYVLETALAELERLTQSKALHLRGPEVAPAAAACAAALLSISEREGLTKEEDRQVMRRVCVDMAVAEGYGNSYAISGSMEPPMQFLFMRAPIETARILAQLPAAGRDSGPLLSSIHFWLLSAKEQEVALSLDLDTGGTLDWLDALGGRSRTLKHASEAVQNIRAVLRPDAALDHAMLQLAQPTLDARSIAHAISILQQTRPLGDIAAVVVEGFFVGCSSVQDGEKDAAARRNLNRSLQSAGLSPTKGWAWSAPEGQVSTVRTPKGLNSTLCAVSGVSSSIQTGGGVEQAQASLRQAPPHALVEHARYRTLLIAIASRSGAAALPLLESLRTVTDPCLAGSVLTMAGEVLGSKAGPVYGLLLDAPALRSDLKLAERVVQAVTRAPDARSGERILALGREIGWGPGKGTYGVYAAIAVAMGRFGDRAAVPALKSMIGTSGLGSDVEVAILCLAAREPQTVDDQTFAQAFEVAAADEYAELDSSLMGEQARAHAVQVLRAGRQAPGKFEAVCRFLADTSKGSHAPPEALPLLLGGLPQAMASAKAHPGEAWEDRNWGGYNTSPQEERVEVMTRAIESLSEGLYSSQGWRVLLDGLLALPDLNLDRIETAEPSALEGVRYATRNVFTKLCRGLLRLGEPAVERALAIASPMEALRAARAALR